MKNLPILLSLLGALLSGSLFAQELPRPSMAREETKNTLPTDYNMKVGPVLLNFTAYSLEDDNATDVPFCAHRMGWTEGLFSRDGG